MRCRECRSQRSQACVNQRASRLRDD
jgi:hypothetical protein